VNGKQDAGGYEGLYARGTTSADGNQHCPPGAPPAPHRMPCAWGWPYQSVNYSFPDKDSTTGSKRLAWGTDWGYLGYETVTTINGNVVTGWPRVSYSVSIVLGPHSQSPTLAMAEQAAVVEATTLSASLGSVRTQGPAGVNRTDEMTYSPAGYNPVYGTWEATADAGRATLTFAVGGAVPLRNPVIVLHGYVGNAVPRKVALNGVPLQHDVDFFASYRPGNNELWLTLDRNLLGSQTLEIASTAVPLTPRGYIPLVRR
jgi:hypothetical protein